jgi:hypothetical protein
MIVIFLFLRVENEFKKIKKDKLIDSILELKYELAIAMTETSYQLRLKKKRFKSKDISC